jgi:hypothetical protein
LRSSLDTLPEEIDERSVSSSSVSRRYVAMTTKQRTVWLTKALRSAIQKVFGDRGVVQRCQLHKQRNILGHLPERMHESVKTILREAWGLHDAKLAKARFERLASSLEADHPGTAASVRAGLEETLTLQGLGIEGTLSRKLRSERDREPEQRDRHLLDEREAPAGRVDDRSLGECRDRRGREVPSYSPSASGPRFRPSEVYVVSSPICSHTDFVCVWWSSDSRHLSRPKPDCL